MIKELSKIQTAALCLILITSICLSFSVVQGVSSTATIQATPRSSANLATTSQNDSNWAGYVAASNLQNPQANITSVNGTWQVPTVQSTVDDTFSAIWIGIGGYFDTSLIQLGSEQDSINGVPQYSFWYELLPSSSRTALCITISPGDIIQASITLVDENRDEWFVTATDLTNNQTCVGNFTYSSSQLSADWIVERPVVNRSPSTLANISVVTFTSCYATIANQTKSIGNYPNVQLTMNQAVMQDRGIGQLVLVSSLSQDGLSFSAASYGQPLPTPAPTAIPEFPSLMLAISLPVLIAISIAIFRKKIVSMPSG